MVVMVVTVIVVVLVTCILPFQGSSIDTRNGNSNKLCIYSDSFIDDISTDAREKHQESGSLRPHEEHYENIRAAHWLSYPTNPSNLA